GGADTGLLIGEAGVQLGVGLVLVAEAAHEPAAAAGDFERVEGGLLHLRRLHADVLEDLEEVLAAAVLAALLVVGGEAGLVAGADLAHLDARAVDLAEAADELAEVDALLAEVEERQALAAEDGLDLDDLHRQAEFLDDAACLGADGVGGLLELGLAVQVLHGGDAE